MIFSPPVSEAERRLDAEEAALRASALNMAYFFGPISGNMDKGEFFPSEYLALHNQALDTLRKGEVLAIPPVQRKTPDEQLDVLQRGDNVLTEADYNTLSARCTDAATSIEGFAQCLSGRYTGTLVEPQAQRGQACEIRIEDDQVFVMAAGTAYPAFGVNHRVAGADYWARSGIRSATLRAISGWHINEAQQQENSAFPGSINQYLQVDIAGGKKKSMEMSFYNHDSAYGDYIQVVCSISAQEGH